jgi:hypothetical protein
MKVNWLVGGDFKQKDKGERGKSHRKEGKTKMLIW